jgi:hypothetical protein
MSRRRKWSDIRTMNERTSANETYVATLKDAMIAIERLTQLRKTRGVTQKEVVRAREVSQGHVSRTECRDDIYLSTLASCVSALGGKLRLVAEFPDQQVALALRGATATAPRPTRAAGS